MNSSGEEAGGLRDLARLFSQTLLLSRRKQGLHRTGMAVNVHGVPESENLAE